MKLFRLPTLLIAAMITMALTACVDDYFADKNPAGLAPGTPVELTLDLTVPESATAINGTSRANPDIELNRQIFDMFLLFFDEEPTSPTKGRLKSKFYFSSITSASETQCDPELSSNGSALIVRTGLGAGKVRHIHTTAGLTRIVGLANVSIKGSADILSRLTEITSFSELESLMVSTIDRSSGLPDLESELSLMSGFYCDNDDIHKAEHYTPCDVKTDSHNGLVKIESSALNGTVWLTPLQSRVRFVIDGNGSLGGTFELRSWQVYNLPGQTPLLCHGLPTSDNETFEPVDIKPLNSALSTTIYGYRNDEGLFGDEKVNNANLYAFSFFPADNHPGNPKQPITSYEQRAAWTGWNAIDVIAPEDKEYTHAPDNATYVVLRGRYTGKTLITESAGSEPREKDVDADVSYTVFLGHASGVNNAVPDFSDFNVLRNTNYTYVVRVKGVNQISVEVNAGTDVRPDAEGNISVLDSRTERLDCHYEQRVITISRKQILDAINNQTFRMIVDEPVFGITHATYRFFKLKNDGTYDRDDNNSLIPAGDYDPEGALPYMQWVQFYRHTNDEISRNYIPFTRPKRDGKLMDVRQFMTELYNFACSGTDPDEKAVFTLYFDEYVYLDDNGNQIHTPTNKPAPWKLLVSQVNVRALTLLGTTRFSADHNSSYSTAGTRFEQMQMQTIYNPNAPGLTRAWATENIEEVIFGDGVNEFNYVPYSYYTGLASISGVTRYGRQNCWKCINQGSNADQGLNRRKIDNLIDTLTGYINRFDTKTWYTECMGRNRDLNGNGVIDNDEFRWYIPSIEQCQLLYVGHEGLTPEAQLYNPTIESANLYIFDNKLTYPFKHYISSSGSKLWSEEGCSTGAMRYNSNSPGDKLEKVHVRCVRDIGTDAARGPQIPGNISANGFEEARFQSIYELVEGSAVEGRTHVDCRVVLSNLNIGATRTTAEKRERPGSVNTFSDTNRPFMDFEVADTILTNVNMVEYFQAVEGTIIQDTRCKELGPGWRLPTITELAVMKWAKPSLIRAFGSRTRSYYQQAGIIQDGWHKLPGWLHIFNNYSNFALDGIQRTNVRCVRDYMSDDELNTDNNETNNHSNSNSRARTPRRVLR